MELLPESDEEKNMSGGDVDQNISIEMDTESEEDKNISGGDVNQNISGGNVLVDKDKPLIRSSSSGIGSFSGDWRCHFFKTYNVFSFSIE